MNPNWSIRVLVAFAVGYAFRSGVSTTTGAICLAGILGYACGWIRCYAFGFDKQNPPLACLTPQKRMTHG